MQNKGIYLKQINALVNMEEKYESLTLSFDKDNNTISMIINIIEETIAMFKMTPAIFQKEECTLDNKESIYIEFTDQEQRDSGIFFNEILAKLNIKKCIS